MRSPFAGPEQVLDYLGRYTHRVALSNDRLVDHHDGRVRFRWKDYADHNRGKVLTLDVDEFLRRFLLHVVPRGFMRIRHFGLLANRTRRGTVARCRVPELGRRRALLGQPLPEDAPPESVIVLIRRLTGVDLSRCPVCGEGRMRTTAIVVRVARAAFDFKEPGKHSSEFDPNSIGYMITAARFRTLLARAQGDHRHFSLTLSARLPRCSG
jgi:hypothetical protein